MVRRGQWMLRLAVMAVALAGLALPAGVLAQQGAQPPSQQPAPEINPAWLKGLKWRLIGPFRGGRSIAVAGIAGNPEVYYFGAVSGGVWKTTDGGVNWTPLFDKEPVSSIGAIAVAPSDPNVIYVGTGEACIRGDISHGDGVYKSVDGGKTWKNIGLQDT
ncbi:MAG: WD40/YVTN/BNR-like repeat-containing protein, partial [Terriglobia bacterium]